MDKYEHLYNKGNYEELLELSTKKLDTLDAKYWQISSLYRLGRLDDALEKSLKYKNEIEKLDSVDVDYHAKFLYRIGSIFWGKGELERALDYFQISLALFEEFGKEDDIANILNNIGLVYYNKGLLDQALENYGKALKIRRKIGDNIEISNTLNNIGELYHRKGELDKALEYYKKSLDLHSEFQYKTSNAASLDNIGEIYHDKGELQVALECYKKSLELYEKMGNTVEISKSHLSLIQIYLDMGNQEKTWDHLQKLNKLADDNDIKIINLRRNFAEGLILKSSLRARDKFNALDIFEKVVKTNDIHFGLLMAALNHVVELLIIEYKAFEENQILNMINLYTSKMYKIAQQQRMYHTLIDVLVLQSKMASIQTNFDLAKTLLTQASVIAADKKMETYKRHIEAETQKFEKDLVRLKREYVSSNVAKRIEQSEILTFIEMARKFGS